MKIRKMELGEEIPLDLLLSADPSQSIIENYIFRGECYLAVKEEQIVGVYVLLPTRPKTSEIVNLAVAQEQQGRGIGTRLILDAMEKAKDKGYKIIEIGTGNSSLRQLALYQRCGFRITGVDRDFFSKHYPDEIVENGIKCLDMIRLSKDL